jgi:hypothetical protein
LGGNILKGEQGKEEKYERIRKTEENKGKTKVKE